MGGNSWETPGLDWTVAVDDALCERFAGCALCGRWPLARLLIRESGTHALAVSLCARCDRQDPQQGRLDALLTERYAPGRVIGV
jgi:hypothetical protein